MDSGPDTWILHPSRGKLLVLNHPSKRYYELDLPVKIEEHVPEEARSVTAVAMKYLTSQVELSDTGEERVIGSWRARRWLGRVVYPHLGSADEIELWLSSEVNFHTESFNELLRQVYALNPRLRDWYDEILALPGVVVRSEARSGAGQTIRTDTTRQLRAVRRERTGPEHYDVSADYTRVAFRFDVVLSGN